MENCGQKRPINEETKLLSGIKAVVLDVYGTATPMSFVEETITPHIKNNVKAYIESNFDGEEFQTLVEEFRTQVAADVAAEAKGAVALPDKDAEKSSIITALVDNVVAQIDEKRWNAALGHLHENMLREAYKTNVIQAEVFDDVMPCLKRAKEDEVKLYSFSCSSVDNQKLLLGYTKLGSLLELFSGHFDTSLGKKTEKETYTKMAEELKEEGNAILFLTSMLPELEAANEAGLKTCRVIRDDSAAGDSKLNCIASLVELFGDDITPKKLCVQETAETKNGDATETAVAAPVEA